jgi:hypothetical protein
MLEDSYYDRESETLITTIDDQVPTSLGYMPDLNEKPCLSMINPIWA